MPGTFIPLSRIKRGQPGVNIEPIKILRSRQWTEGIGHGALRQLLLTRRVERMLSSDTMLIALATIR